MTEWCRVGAADDLAEDSAKPVRVDGKVIALVRHGGAYWAVDAQCPHAGGPLFEGSVENGKLTCPWHGREFDLASGQCEGFQGVATYAVEIRPDGIYIAT